jgi:hypothetical protein
MRVAAMRLGRNAVCTVAFGGLLLVGGAACANESAADAIAEKFSRAAEPSERREAEAKKAEAKRATARKVEAGRKAAAERKAVEQRKAKAAGLQRLTEERKAQEARLAEAARVAGEAEEERLADKFRRTFERGRSAWLSAH